MKNRYSSIFNLQSSSSGFTLIEAVVATAVFAFVVSSMVGVYLSAIQLDRKTRAQRAVTQSARFITEFLTKEVRNGTINYASYGGLIPANNNDLYILNQAGELEHIYASADTCTVTSTCDLLIAKNSTVSNLNSSNVKVSNIKFYIQPRGNPYTDIVYNEQPRVTMVLELTSNGLTFTDSAKIDLETTFTTRAYPARP
jgi:type II secretory pathway pseudopilin PulG